MNQEEQDFLDALIGLRPKIEELTAAFTRLAKAIEEAKRRRAEAEYNPFEPPPSKPKLISYNVDTCILKQLPTQNLESVWCQACSKTHVRGESNA
jgi:hypothetical protein